MSARPRLDYQPSGMRFAGELMLYVRTGPCVFVIRNGKRFIRKYSRDVMGYRSYQYLMSLLMEDRRAAAQRAMRANLERTMFS